MRAGRSDNLTKRTQPDRGTKRTQVDLGGWGPALVAASLALGGTAAWAVAPLLEHVTGWNLTANRVHDWTPRAFLANGGAPLVLHLTAIGLAPLTLLVALMPLLRRGDERREAGRSPGAVACRAVTAVLLLETTFHPLYQSFLLYGELLRVMDDAGSNINQLPKLPPRLLAKARWDFAAVAFHWGEHAGFAVLGVLIAGRIVGLPARPPGALNRLGVALGLIWVAIALGHALMPPA